MWDRCHLAFPLYYIYARPSHLYIDRAVAHSILTSAPHSRIVSVRYEQLEHLEQGQCRHFASATALLTFRSSDGYTLNLLSTHAMPPTKRKDQAGPSDQKRTRFASPPPARDRSTSLDEQDDMLEDDLQQGAGRAKQKSKRQLKDKNGYGSDSSDDEEGVVPSRRPKEEEEDVDMFGEEEEKPDKKGKGKEKKKEFMDIQDIEGQEFERRRGGTTDDESDSEADEPGDERSDRKKRKEKALGFEVTAFNMKAEMDEGKFTADGEAYVENDRDPDEKHDVWLADLDKDAIRKARKAHREREKLEAEREEAESQGVGKEREVELMRAAVNLMERGETVLEALQRHGHEAEEKRKKEDQGKKKTWAQKQKERKALMAEQDAK